MSDHHPHSGLLQSHPLNYVSTVDIIRPACRLHPEPGATAQIVFDIHMGKKVCCSSHLNALNQAMLMFLDADALTAWTRLFESMLPDRVKTTLGREPSIIIVLHQAITENFGRTSTMQSTPAISAAGAAATIPAWISRGLESKAVEVRSLLIVHAPVIFSVTDINLKPQMLRRDIKNMLPGYMPISSAHHNSTRLRCARTAAGPPQGQRRRGGGRAQAGVLVAVSESLAQPHLMTVHQPGDALKD